MCMQPYATAIDAAYRFFQNLCGTSDCTFGFVGFSVAGPASTSSYKCAYASISGVKNYYSLLLTTPANANPVSNPNGVYGAYVYEPPQGTNPNFWLTTPLCCVSSNYLPCGPAGSPTGCPYDATYNTLGPNGQTSNIPLYGSGTTYPSNTNTCWCFNNGGFQMPRYPLISSSDSYKGGSNQQTSFLGVAGNSWFGWAANAPGNANSTSQGFNGLFHCRPLYDTDGLEALKVAYYNLTSIASLNATTTLATGMSLPTMGPGTKEAIIFFTDGVPTDDATPFPNYTADIVTPAQASGTAIYSIGLALNDSVKITQSDFLSRLSNYGANGSQYFQVSTNAGLESTFTGISRQLAQCQR